MDGVKENRYSIRVLDRAFSVLSLLSDGKPRSMTALSGELGISSSTMFRLLASLAHLNYVQRENNSGEYRLGLACLELARAYYEANDLRKVAFPELEALRDRTTETVHLGILDGTEVVYLEKLHGLHAVGLMMSSVGGRAPSHCTGLGKVLLAFCDPEDVRQIYRNKEIPSFTARTIHDIDSLTEHLLEVRERGYAFDEGEHEAEVRCVAVPIYNADGDVSAAISVSGPATRMDPLMEKVELIRITLETAQKISRELGYREIS